MIGGIKKIKYVIAFIAISIISLAGAYTVSAADVQVESRAWGQELFKKGLLESAKKCMGYFNEKVEAQNIMSDGFIAVFRDGGEETKVAIPSGFGIKSGNTLINEITCADLFFEDNSIVANVQNENKISSILKIGATKIDGAELYTGGSLTSISPQVVDKVMWALGYVRRLQDSDEIIGNVSFQWNLFDQNGTMQGTQNRSIVLNVKNNKIEIPDSQKFGACNGILQQCDPSTFDGVVNPKGAPVWFEQIFDELNGGWVDNKIVICTIVDGCPNNSNRIVTYNPNLGQYAWTGFASELKSKVYALGSSGNFIINQGVNSGYHWDFVASDSETVANYIYVMEDGSVAKTSAAFLKNITGKDVSSTYPHYTEENRIAYLLNSIKNNFYGEYSGSIIECELDGYSLGNGRIAINVDANGVRRKDCGILKIPEYYNSKTPVYGFTNGGWFNSMMVGSDALDDAIGVTQPYDFETVVKKINQLTENLPMNTNTAVDNNTTVDPDEYSGDPCWDSSGLNGMNWVLCPTAYNLRDSAEGISGLIDRFMEVESFWYDSNSKTYEVWGYMRGIANVLLTIILLVIVFSQLTGYGIDNYGIKKMLPKLVIMAILINLSFILCQLAIDASNIIGMGINNLLTSIGGNQWTFSEVISSVAGAFMAVVAGTTTAAPLILTGIMIGTGAGPIAVFVLILSLLAILVGVFIFFLTLGARVIIIIMFSILSPIAFACYILPNTQKYFKNWWKVFSAALIIYPICGAMYGVSSIIRGIVFHGGDGEMHVLMALVAILTPVLPYYIMPTLLKNSMNALGSVGGALNSLGNSLRKGFSSAESALRNSETYRIGERESARNRQLSNANRMYRKLGEKDKSLGGKGFGTNLIGRDQRRMARALETKKSLGAEDISAGAKLALEEFGDNEDLMKEAWEEAYVAGNTKRLLTLTDAMHSKYGVGAIASIGKIMAKHGDKVNDSNINNSLDALSKNTITNASFGKDFRVKATDAFKYATTGGVRNGAHVSFDSFSNYNGITTTFEDVLGQGAAAVERMALAGGFNQMLGPNASGKMLTSDSQIIKNLLSDKDKKAAVEAQAYIDNYVKDSDSLRAYIDKNVDLNDLDSGLFAGCYKVDKNGQKVFDYSKAIKVVAEQYEASAKNIVNGVDLRNSNIGSALASNPYEMNLRPEKPVTPTPTSEPPLADGTITVNGKKINGGGA